MINEVGETHPTTSLNEGFQCITDKMPCCRGENIGEWQFPNGTAVPLIGSATTFYRNRGSGDGAVNLNRLNDVMMPTGRFCCVVPDATNTDVTMCAIIG